MFNKKTTEDEVLYWSIGEEMSRSDWEHTRFVPFDGQIYMKPGEESSVLNINKLGYVPRVKDKISFEMNDMFIKIEVTEVERCVNLRRSPFFNITGKVLEIYDDKINKVVFPIGLCWGGEANL